MASVDCKPGPFGGPAGGRLFAERVKNVAMSPSLAVVIPAFNAEKTISGVIERIPDDAWAIIDTVFVIDDGSADGTASVVQALKSKYGKIELMSFAKNRGYGSAVREGLRQCRDTKADYFVCLHADGQYPPEKLYLFTRYMYENGVDLLQGSRHKDGTAREGGMPLYKVIGGKVLTAFENAVFGLKMTDYHSGYIFYSRRALESIPFDRLSYSFDFDLEVIACARRRGLKVDELGIPTHYGDEESYLNPVTYGMRVLRVMLRYRVGGYADDGGAMS